MAWGLLANPAAAGVRLALTNQEALERAFANSLQLQSRQAESERSRAAVAQAESATFPLLGLTTRFDVTRSPQGDLLVYADRLRGLRVATGVTDYDTQSSSVGGTLGLTYDLDLLGERAARIALAREQAAGSDLELARLASTIRQDVANAYFDVQDAQAELRIARASLELARRNRDDVAKLNAS
ncbi:MAG: TolC family protein, partial [Candidatus Sericytochromatia bacterium]|nr:TolC family protein [Candidatus Tanganyikabacteria bacterium]